MSKPLDEHAEIRRRFGIIKRYWAKRGWLSENGRSAHRTISIEMEQEAMAAHEAARVPEPPPPGYEPPPKPNPLPHLLVEPGTGELKVAVLCPGPSLTATWPACADVESFDLVIAVNNAVEHSSCDWWVSNDHGPMKKFTGRPRVGIGTSGANADTLNGDRSFKPKGMTDADLDALTIVATNALGHPKSPRKMGWSTSNAIILAARLGARTIELYGDDKTGTEYYDGTMNKGSKVARWDREKKNQSALVAVLESAGVSVRNIQPDQEA